MKASKQVSIVLAASALALGVAALAPQQASASMDYNTYNPTTLSPNGTRYGADTTYVSNNNNTDNSTYVIKDPATTEVKDWPETTVTDDDPADYSPEANSLSYWLAKFNRVLGRDYKF